MHSAAPVSSAAATGWGETVVAAASAGGERPATSTPPLAHGSGTTRRASAAASTNASAVSTANITSTARAPPSAYAGEIASGIPTPCGSRSRPSTSVPLVGTARSLNSLHWREAYWFARSRSPSSTHERAASSWCSSSPA